MTTTASEEASQPHSSPHFGAASSVETARELVFFLETHFRLPRSRSLVLAPAPPIRFRAFSLATDRNQGRKEKLRVEPSENETEFRFFFALSSLSLSLSLSLSRRLLFALLFPASLSFLDPRLRQSRDIAVADRNRGLKKGRKGKPRASNRGDWIPSRSPYCFRSGPLLGPFVPLTRQKPP